MYYLFFVAPPFFIQYPRPKIESIERNSVTMTCRARGNPRPQIEWSKEGLPLALDPHYDVRPSGDLFIREVRMEDHGMYRCRATNRAGGVAASTRLVVTGNCNTYEIKRALNHKLLIFINFLLEKN